MDYLTSLTTRSLLLFPSPASYVDDTASPPGTPSATLPLPSPVAIPVYNLLSPDTPLFFFLLQHVLRRPEHLVSRADKQEAEVLVWRELDKAAVFLRELGMAVGRGEQGMDRVAKRCGVVLVQVKETAEGRGAGHEKTDSVDTLRDWSAGSQNGREGAAVIA